MTMTSQIVRIVLRYFAGILVAGGLVSAGTGEQIASDPALLEYIVAGIGLLVALITERWFSKEARRTT